MNWGREALDLYEKNLNKVGKIEYRGEFPYTLLPTFHSTMMIMEKHGKDPMTYQEQPQVVTGHPKVKS